MNRNIRVLRGTAEGIENNKNEILAPGQPLYNVTDKFLTVGVNEGDTVSNLHPVATNVVHGYFDKVKSDSNNPEYDYELKVSDTKDRVELKSTKNILIDASDELTIKSDKINLSNKDTTQNTIIDSGEKSIIINDNLIIDKDGVINQIGKLSDLTDNDTSKPTTIVAAINEVRIDLNTTINNLDYSTTNTVGKTLTKLTQTNGKVSATFGNIELSSDNKINSKTVSEIFETNSSIVKNATYAANAINVQTKSNEYKTLQNALLEMIYPVGSVYMSVSNSSPATFLGGTWQRIYDCCIHAAADGVTAGNTGGSYTLTNDNLPSHSHSLNTHTHSIAGHTHTLNNHTHTVNSHSHSFIPAGTIGNTDLSGTMTFADAMNLGDISDTVLGATGKFTLNNTGGGSTDYSLEVNAQDGTSDKITFNGNHNHTFKGSAGTTSSASPSTGGPSTANTGSTNLTTGAADGNTGAAGGGSEFRPKYIEMYVWKRTA